MHLKATGQIVTDYNKILSVLNSLCHEYDSVAVLILSQQKSMTLQDANYLLMIHERRILQLNNCAKLDIASASANFLTAN